VSSSRGSASDRPEPDAAADRAAPGEGAGAGWLEFRRRMRRHLDSCEICGSPVNQHHCKIVCSNCGAMRDCSDP
jgi:hypothetical protein